mmetsp:Transcript_31577/g.66149  ORF Transcript_31577/g.66149 Transcript_31577/m.66149 type:complete len:584 (+) Transcript_31577:43-1794(+)
MTKRSANECLVGNSDTNNGRTQSKVQRPSSADGGGNTCPPHPRLVKLISSLSSSSCSADMPPSCHDASGKTAKPFRRMVSRKISSVIDNHATKADENFGSDGTVRQLTRLINARILQRDGALLPGSMTIDPSSSLIVDINVDHQTAGGGGDHSSDDGIVEVIDCEGQILSPGFIDIQLNGAYGVDFSNDGNFGASSNSETARIDPANTQYQKAQGLDAKDILYVATRLVETGVTSFCPTVISSSPQTYRRILPLMRKTRKQQKDVSKEKVGCVGANILGMHLEGPFFAPSKGGAHDRQQIVAPVKGMASVEEVYGIRTYEGGETPVLDDIDIITLAPELPGALDAIQSLTKFNPSASPGANPHSVVVSCGHTEATYEDGIQAVSHGATLLTHLYNAMNPFHHRNPGLVGLLSSETKLRRMNLKRPFFSMIVDGIHVHESAVCMAYQSNPRGCVLVTDAMAAMGLGDGDHHLGSMRVCIKEGRATLAGTDTLAGSVVSMDTCVKRFRQFTGCEIGKALLCATLHPAMVLKRHVARQKRGDGGRAELDAPIGILEVGSKADLVVLNDELDVLGTWVGGVLQCNNR